LEALQVFALGSLLCWANRDHPCIHPCAWAEGGLRERHCLDDCWLILHKYS
jgi:hypothetical protein